MGKSLFGEMLSGYDKLQSLEILCCIKQHNDRELYQRISYHRRGHPKPQLKSQKSCTGLLSISKAKKKDLLSILNLIDPAFHNFYKGLPDHNIPHVDPDLNEEDGDVIHF